MTNHVPPSDEDAVFGPPPLDVHSALDPYRGRLHRRLPELLNVEQLCRHGGDLLSSRCEALIDVDDFKLPLISLTLGKPETAKHCLLLTGGVHGVERIGTQVLIAWLETVLERCRWDRHWRSQFEDEVAIIALPLVNPAGMLRNSRCNANSVDLNRHAPIDAEDRVPFLVGGQRLWRRLPWYRGRYDRQVEPEFQVLKSLIRRHSQAGRTMIAIDFHSGFGFRDHLWIPHAYRKEAIDDIGSYVALKLLWERNFPHHNYAFGPQAMHYLSHGDMWDYFYLRCREQGVKLLPLTLEMGSWLWVKKHPRQLFSFAGLFNPTVPHRHARVLRGHLLLLDFMLAACRNTEQWQPRGEQEMQLRQIAQSLWYRQLDD